MNPLRALDERVLPRLARGLVRIGGLVPGGGRGSAGSRMLLGGAVLSVLAVAATAVYLTERPAPVDETIGDVVRVGAAEGDQVGAYVATSRSELASLAGRSGDMHALVSFASYVEPGALAGLLGDIPTVRVYARVPLPNVQTEIVSFPVHTLTADVPAAMKRTAVRKERLADESDQAAAGLTGTAERERTLRTFYQQDAKANRAEAAAYRKLCGCVYAAVVRAAPRRLAELAKRTGVRVVDAAPEASRLDRTVFLPLQPEQLTVVSPPSDAALPSPTGR